MRDGDHVRGTRPDIVRLSVTRPRLLLESYRPDMMRPDDDSLERRMKNDAFRYVRRETTWVCRGVTGLAVYEAVYEPLRPAWIALTASGPDPEYRP